MYVANCGLPHTYLDTYLVILITLFYLLTHTFESVFLFFVKFHIDGDRDAVVFAGVVCYWQK